MKKLKLKRFVLPTFFAAVGLTIILIAIIMINSNQKLTDDENLNYVSNTIISEEIPVINTNQKVIYPYIDKAVKIGKNYYDYKGSKEEQEKSLIVHDNTYLQNSGIDFICDHKFEVIAVLDGTVTNVKEDELLGKIVEVSHGNDYISIYQSLDEVNVKKGDNINQGQVIGMSGTNKLDRTIGNHLHFEFYANGQIVNPTLYLDKEIQNLKLDN